MAGFTRRFSSFPDRETIRAIEGVIIVDEAPAGAIEGADTGCVAFVGEYEDGGFAVDPVTPSDVYHPVGGPIAVAKEAWPGLVGTLGFPFNGLKNQFPACRISNEEFWNGNAYVQAKGLAFRKFYAVRVDTSIGNVTFSPLAFLETASAGPWSLSAASQTIVFAIDGAGDSTATFTAVAASVTGAAASFATLGAGEYVDISIDGKTAVRTTFQTGDTTIGAVVSRINAAFGSPIASNSSSQLKLASSTLGTSSSVQIVSGSTGTVAKLGHSVGTSSGSGAVANLNAVTFAELKTLVEAASASSTVRQTSTGKARICSKAGTTGTVRVQSGSTATAFGFTTGSTITASSGAAPSTIPAGTVLKASGTGTSSRVVTMQTLQVPASTTRPITVKVRPAQDDGTYAGAIAAAIDTIETIPSPTAEWTVTNVGALSSALTEAQKDTAYLAALDATKAISGASRIFDYVGSARQSARVSPAVLANAKATSSLAHHGRKARVSPPNGASLASMSGASFPSVATLRDERACYATGWKKFISEIYALGATNGGIGFTDDGIVEVHGDVVLASVDSILNPEESSGQPTDIIPKDLYVGVCSVVAAWTIDDYIAAKAAGICASFMHESEGPQFMSYVTTVDKSSVPAQVPAQRIKLADWLTDSVAEFQGKYVKTLRTDARRTALLTKLQEFLQSLVDAERIDGFTAEEGPRIRRAHVLDWKVEPLDSMDSIINRTSIGEGALEKPSTARLSA